MQHSSTYPRDFFLHLLSSIILYVSVISILVLLFQYINILFPDPLHFYYSGALDSIRWSTAALFILFPCFLFCSWLLQREYTKHPEKAAYHIRKWLLYLTIFLASGIIIVDLITLVYNFLSGELSVRFLLKILAVFLVSGIVFGYMLWDVRRTSFGPSLVQRRSAWGVSAFVLLALAGSFFLVGSPVYQRNVRLDEQRTNDLGQLQNEILNFWMQKNVLPASLEDLSDAFRGFIPPQDPITGAQYEYLPKSALSFDLCATFAVPTPKPLRDVPNRNSYAYSPYGNALDQVWEHASGRTCFERTIDPELYDNQNNPPRLKEIPVL